MTNSNMYWTEEKSHEENYARCSLMCGKTEILHLVYEKNREYPFELYCHYFPTTYSRLPIEGNDMEEAKEAAIVWLTDTYEVNIDKTKKMLQYYENDLLEVKKMQKKSSER